MGDHQMRDALLSGASSGLALVGAMSGNSTVRNGAGAARGVIGMTQQRLDEDPDFLSATSAVSGVAGAVARMRGMSGVSSVMSGIGSTIGVGTGIAGALDSTASTQDRVISGAGAYGSGLSLAANIVSEGAYSTSALLGTEVGAIGTTGTVGAGGAATGLGVAGALVGSGLAGWGLGSAMREGAASDDARHTIFGNNELATQTGRGMENAQTPVDSDRTAVEAWTDFCAENVGNPIANRGWRNARDLERHGAAMNENLDAAGLDTMGDLAQGATNLYASGVETAGEIGGAILGGGLTAIGAIPATLAGDAVAIDSWFD